MKKLFLLTCLLFLPVMPAKAQQTNIFETCIQHREHYVPGGQDRFGRYYQGQVQTERLNVDCYDNSRVLYRGVPQQYNNNYAPTPYPYPRYYNRGRYYRYATPVYYCNPTRSVYGALLGGSIGSALTSTRNNRRNRGWATGLGAALGGLAYSC